MMGIVKNFIDEFAKHKMLIYFAILWGTSMFFWSLYDIGHYAFGYGETFLALPFLYNLLKLIAGIFLAIFGIKLMKTNFLEAITTEKALLYFLILWAASFFFTGLYDILEFGPWIFEYWENLLAFLGAIANLFAGAVLALFAWNILNEKEPSTTQ